MLGILTLPWVIPTVCGCSVAIVAIVAHAVSEAWSSAAAANLKRSMVEQGMSAMEIEQVLRASAIDAAPAKPLKKLDVEQPPTNPAGKVVVGSSLGFGAVLAVVMSWTASKSVLWAVVHGLLGWFYVVYFLITSEDWSWL